jgi:hypothetical protein
MTPYFAYPFNTEVNTTWKGTSIPAYASCRGSYAHHQLTFVPRVCSPTLPVALNILLEISKFKFACKITLRTIQYLYCWRLPNRLNFWSTIACEYQLIQRPLKARELLSVLGCDTLTFSVIDVEWVSEIFYPLAVLLVLQRVTDVDVTLNKCDRRF